MVFCCCFYWVFCLFIWMSHITIYKFNLFLVYLYRARTAQNSFFSIYLYIRIHYISILCDLLVRKSVYIAKSCSDCNEICYMFVCDHITQYIKWNDQQWGEPSVCFIKYLLFRRLKFSSFLWINDMLFSYVSLHHSDGAGLGEFTE